MFDYFTTEQIYKPKLFSFFNVFQFFLWLIAMPTITYSESGSWFVTAIVLLMGISICCSIFVEYHLRRLLALYRDSLKSKD